MNYLIKIIQHQAMLMLKEKGLSRGDLNNYKYLQYKYNIAIKLLCQIGA
jgi:hypothetical protein